MPRKYKKGLKERTGENAGSECVGYDCKVTKSSSWSKGFCAGCRSEARRNGTACIAVSQTVEMECAAVISRGNYAAAAAALASGAPTMLQVVQATVLPVASGQ